MQNNNTARKIKKITQLRLQSIAIHYMEEYGGSEYSLRAVLDRCIKKSRYRDSEQDISNFSVWVNEIVQKAKEYGYINDSIFAKQRVKLLHSQGNSKRMIMAKLKHKGISDTNIEIAIAELSSDAELVSATNYSRKRKFGIFAIDGGADESDKNKQLASLARRGFSYEICQKALKGDD